MKPCDYCVDNGFCYDLVDGVPPGQDETSDETGQVSTLCIMCVHVPLHVHMYMCVHVHVPYT